MTQDNDTTDIKFNTTTQMLRKWHLTELPTSSIDLMAERERIHLSMAFMAGQLNKWTFDEWYNETFNTISLNPTKWLQTFNTKEK